MKNVFVRSILGALISLLLTAVGVTAQTNGEWPQWRGANRDGISKETGLLKQWPDGGPPQVWKASGAGSGYSSFAISKGRLYTMGSRGDREFVIAFDVTNGKEVWATPHGKTFDNDRGSGPRGTPTIDGDRIYALGGSGDLSSLDARTGKIIWTLNVLSRFGGSNIRWGISESPLVIGDKVLVNAGGRDASIVALKKIDGTLVWKSQSDEAGYSSALPVQVGGTTQVIFFTGNRVVALDVRDGKLLWEYTRPSNDVANIATPVARGNRVWISSDYGTGGGLVEIKADGKGQEVYFTKDMRNHHATSILIGDHLYGFSSAILTAMRFDTGEVAWRDRSVGKGSLTFADGHLYAFSENGVVGLVEVNPTEYREKGRFRMLFADLVSSSGCRRTAVHPRSGHDLRVRCEGEEIGSSETGLLYKVLRFKYFRYFLVSITPLFRQTSVSRDRFALISHLRCPVRLWLIRGKLPGLLRTRRNEGPPGRAGNVPELAANRKSGIRLCRVAKSVRCRSRKQISR